MTWKIQLNWIITRIFYHPVNQTRKTHRSRKNIYLKISLTRNPTKIQFEKFLKNSNLPCLSHFHLFFCVHPLHMQRVINWTFWVLLQHKERWGRLLAPEEDSEWQHFEANKTAGHQWVIPGWLKVRHSKKVQSIHLPKLHCKEISYVPLVSPIRITGHTFALHYHHVLPRRDLSTVLMHFSR